jgi:hypothetical protein
METILARRFDPFYVSDVPDFPNVVFVVSEWVYFFPIFKELKEENLAQHLHEFHELMHQWEIHHEDVLLKMFMFSLAGDAHELYHSLPPAIILSLREFHVAFSRHCQSFYSSEFIWHSCCEEYEDNDQDMVVPNEDHKEDEYVLGEVMELVKYLSTKIERLEYEEGAEDFPVLEVDVLNISIDDENEYFIAIDALVSTPDEPVVSYLKEEAILEEDCSRFIPDISHDVFTFGIEKKDQEIVLLLQDGGVLCSPSFDDYSDEEKQSPTSCFDSMGRIQPVYDSYKSDPNLDMKDFQEHSTKPYHLFIK